jgi:ribose transport system ATP-binding protein
MTDILLQIENASKRYGDVPALVDADLTLRRGEVHALIGENGAGKSTLIKIMAGVVTPDSARFQLNGQSITIHAPQDALAHGMRFIHQELSFVPELSVAENIFLGESYPRRLGVMVDWGRLNDMADATMKNIRIDHINPRTTMARLSVGDQMLVRIAAAFAGDRALVEGESRANKVYVMDEPTAALNGDEVALLFAVIRRLRELDDAVLYVSHRLDEIFEIADTTTVMRNGQVVATQPTADLTHDDMIRLMTGRDFDQVYPARQEQLKAETLLHVIDLSTQAVHGVDLTLGRGEVLGVTGLRASGQTDLLRALIGVDRATAGTITLNGDPLPDGATARWRVGVTYVPRERRSEGLVMGRSVRDNLTLPHLRDLARGGVIADRGREHALASQHGDRTRLKSTGTAQTVRELSGGNQQKVVFARAIAGDPAVLLLDEPTRGVDVGAKFDIYTLIREVSAAGTGVILSSTDLPELIGMCDRIAVMRDGRVATVVEAAGLTQQDLLSLCYRKSHDVS